MDAMHEVRSGKRSRPLNFGDFEGKSKMSAIVIDDTASESASVGRNKEIVIDDAAKPIRRTLPYYLNTLEDEKYGQYDVNLNSLRLSDIIEGNTDKLKNAILGNFMFDLPWIISECPAIIGMDEMTLVHGETGEGEFQLKKDLRLLRDMNPDLNVQVIAPYLPLPYGTFHAKFAVLLYANNKKLRVMITTANFLSSDWHKKNQGIWVQDFLPKDEESKGTKDKFCNDLVGFLMKCGISSWWQDTIKGFDFRCATGDLIASIPGTHRDAACDSWGHMKMRSLLSDLRVEADVLCNQSLSTVCQFSSLGSISENWFLNEFLKSLSCRSSNSKERKSTGCRPSKLYVILPTLNQVRTSIEGLSAGASLPIREKNLKDFMVPLCHRWGFPYYSSYSFKKDIQQRTQELERDREDDSDAGSDCSDQENDKPSNAAPPPPVVDESPFVRKREQSLRSRAMPHIKLFFSFNEDSYEYAVPNAGKEIFWLYCGSHNLSRAAWGTLKSDGSALTIRSFELGVLLSPTTLNNKAPTTLKRKGTTLRDSRGLSYGWEFIAEQSLPTLCGVPFNEVNETEPLDPSEDAPRQIMMPIPIQLPPTPYSVNDAPWCLEQLI